MQVGDKMYIPVVITELGTWENKSVAHVTFADGMGSCSVFTETLLSPEELDSKREAEKLPQFYEDL